MIQISKINLVNELIHKTIKSSIIRKNSRWSSDIFLEYFEETGRVSKDQEFLKNMLDSEKPIFIGRFGAIELATFINYLQIERKLGGADNFSLIKYYFDMVQPNWWSIASQRSMCSNAGFFPSTPENLTKWGELMERDIHDLDVLLRWLKIEDIIVPQNKHMNFLGYKNVEMPFLFKNPYTEVFDNKTILVVSPFSNSIRYQYERYSKIWGSDIKFELKTLQSYNILSGNKNEGDPQTWFEALDLMKEQIEKQQFDIALIGCGAYAFHLAAHIKRLGKKAITTCGATQLYFGIYGNRWENFLKDKGILNEYWTRPFDIKPKGFEKVENAAYW